jgi:glutamate racemase
MGRRVSVLHPGEIIANSLKKYLAKHPELALKTSPSPTIQYCTTDSPETFRKSAENFLGQKIKNLHQVNISEL